MIKNWTLLCGVNRVKMAPHLAYAIKSDGASGSRLIYCTTCTRIQSSLHKLCKHFLERKGACGHLRPKLVCGFCRRSVSHRDDFAKHLSRMPLCRQRLEMSVEAVVSLQEPPAPVSGEESSGSVALQALCRDYRCTLPGFSIFLDSDAYKATLKRNVASSSGLAADDDSGSVADDDLGSAMDIDPGSIWDRPGMTLRPRIPHTFEREWRPRRKTRSSTRVSRDRSVEASPPRDGERVVLEAASPRPASSGQVLAVTDTLAAAASVMTLPAVSAEDGSGPKASLNSPGKPPLQVAVASPSAGAGGTRGDGLLQMGAVNEQLGYSAAPLPEVFTWANGSMVAPCYSGISGGNYSDSSSYSSSYPAAATGDYNTNHWQQQYSAPATAAWGQQWTGSSSNSHSHGSYY